MKKKIKLAGYQGNQSIHTQAMSNFIKDIENSFDIVFDMDVTLNNEMASSLIEKTINEEVHISYLWSSYYEKIIPEIKLLDLPYLFNERVDAYRILDIKFFNYINKKINRKRQVKRNCKVLRNSSRREVFWKTLDGSGRII